jgi:hypothetical protein
MQKDPFSTIAHNALSATPVRALIETNSAIILERIARGGGATKWYHCSNQQCLEDVELSLSPGSAVSFYFDRRICRASYSKETAHILRDTVSDTGEILIGVPRSNNPAIDVEIISGPNELTEFLSTLSLGAPIFYGVFPARDNDGVNAVTVILPDIDGVVRPHPH